MISLKLIRELEKKLIIGKINKNRSEIEIHFSKSDLYFGNLKSKLKFYLTFYFLYGIIQPQKEMDKPFLN